MPNVIPSASNTRRPVIAGSYVPFLGRIDLERLDRRPARRLGQPPPLFTDHKAPAARDLDGPTDVSLWIIQRDERLVGVHAYEACVTP